MASKFVRAFKAANADLGKKGVLLTIYCGALSFMCNSMGTGLTNTLFRPIADGNGWDYAQLIGFNTYAGWLGIAASVLFGQWQLKKGAKFISAVGLFAAAGGIWLFGHAGSVLVFAIAVALDRCAATAYDKNASVTLVTSWFPTRKAIVLGWSTMGVPLVNILFIPAVTWGAANLGISTTSTLIAAVFIVLGLVTILFVKNTPEECGAYPDNIPPAQPDVAAGPAQEGYRSPWTFKKLASNKNVWIMSLGMGLMWLAVIGVVSQDIPRIISLGYSEGFATWVLFVCAFISIGGSYFWGLLDQLVGTKKALIAFGVFFTLVLGVYLLQSYGAAYIWVSVACSMFCVGGIPNLVPSMIGTVFGRYDFPAANRFISPICNLLFSSAYLVVSACLSAFGGYNQAYLILMGICLAGLVLMCFASDKMIGYAPHAG